VTGVKVPASADAKWQLADVRRRLAAAEEAVLVGGLPAVRYANHLRRALLRWASESPMRWMPTAASVLRQLQDLRNGGPLSPSANRAEDGSGATLTVCSP
jgi:hypothetical protein